MEGKDFSASVKEALLGILLDELQNNNQMMTYQVYGAIMSGAMSAIGEIAQLAGEDPDEVVKEIAAQTYEQIWKN